MKILFEIEPLENTRKTGIATYIDNLCRALLEFQGEHSFTLWGPDITQDPFPDIHNKQFLGNGLLTRATLEELWKYTPFSKISNTYDCYHLPFPAFPAPCSSKKTCTVSTIYDLAFAYFPESITEAISYRYLSRTIPLQAEHSDAVITISQSAKEDIVNILGIPAERVVVSYPGCDITAPTDDELHRKDHPAVLELKLPDRYLLCLGTWEPRKNLPTLFRAIKLLHKRLVKENIFLCMSGMKGWKYNDAESLIEELGIGDRINVLGYVKREWLPLLYARAEIFVYPSMYEGFGMPVVEAMACGTPVITTNVSSLPEAGGDAALLVDPKSVDELASAINKLLDSQNLRDGMIHRGFQHSAKFSWEQSAREHMAIYEKLGSSNS